MKNLNRKDMNMKKMSSKKRAVLTFLVTLFGSALILEMFINGLSPAFLICLFGGILAMILMNWLRKNARTEENRFPDSDATHGR